jgi:hypothetical protein
MLMLNVAVSVPLIAGSIVIWLGLAQPRDYWWAVTIALPFVFIGIAYLSLYRLPERKHPERDARFVVLRSRECF